MLCYNVVYVFDFMSYVFWKCLHLVCIWPFGMSCLSAWRMIFVKIVFAVGISGSGQRKQHLCL